MPLRRRATGSFTGRSGDAGVEADLGEFPLRQAGHKEGCEPLDVVAGPRVGRRSVDGNRSPREPGEVVEVLAVDEDYRAHDMKHPPGDGINSEPSSGRGVDGPERMALVLARQRLFRAASSGPARARTPNIHGRSGFVEAQPRGVRRQPPGAVPGCDRPWSRPPDHRR